MTLAAPIEPLEAIALTIPTDRPESDGTITWDRTTMVVVHAAAGGQRGIGWTFADGAAASLVRGVLSDAVRGRDALATRASFDAMDRAVRNIGRPGLVREAISAVDIALWDLKAKLLGLPLARLLGGAHADVMLYGSGGFCSYDDETLASQLGGWAADGFRAVKMKVGREPGRDRARVRLAREAIGPDVQLFVDANGAWSRKEALAWADALADLDVVWLEEPVSSEDLAGLRALRDGTPAGMDVTAGEYGYVLDDFRRFLVADCLDVVQADATRCGGITGFLSVGALCDAFGRPLSAHCAPHVHAHVGTAASRLRHVEYFHDHARIEHLVLDGALRPERGRLRVDLARPGLGVSLRADATRYA